MSKAKIPQDIRAFLQYYHVRAGERDGELLYFLDMEDEFFGLRANGETDFSPEFDDFLDWVMAVDPHSYLRISSQPMPEQPGEKVEDIVFRQDSVLGKLVANWQRLEKRDQLLHDLASVVLGRDLDGDELADVEPLVRMEKRGGKAVFTYQAEEVPLFTTGRTGVGLDDLLAVQAAESDGLIVERGVVGALGSTGRALTGEGEFLLSAEDAKERFAELAGIEAAMQLPKVRRLVIGDDQVTAPLDHPLVQMVASMARPQIRD